MTLKFISGGKIFFLLRQEDDRCTGTRIGLSHYCFYCIRFLFPPEVEKSYETKIYIWGEIFFFIAAGGRSLYRDSRWIESLLFLLHSVSVPAGG
jgi:hypothetical protein